MPPNTMPMKGSSTAERSAAIPIPITPASCRDRQHALDRSTRRFDEQVRELLLRLGRFGDGPMALAALLAVAYVDPYQAGGDSSNGGAGSEADRDHRQLAQPDRGGPEPSDIATQHALPSWYQTFVSRRGDGTG